jgi:hypothetical protein
MKKSNKQDRDIRNILIVYRDPFIKLISLSEKVHIPYMK